MPYIGRDLNRGNYLKLDDISSSFNGSTQTFNLTVGGSAFTPGSAFSILVSVGGVIQEPESAYQVNNSEITFANAPTAQDGFFCTALAVPIGVGVPGNGTVNGPQMAKPFNYDGFFYLDDANNRVGIGSLSPSETLDIIGNTKISGIITASTFSGSIVGNTNNASGISTFYDLRVSNNLTVEGTTTTLDTDVTGVDRLEINANSNSDTAIVGIQSGTADIVNLFDGATKVVTVDDIGNVGLGTAIPGEALHLGDSKKIGLGYGTDLEIYHTGSHGYIKNTTNYTYYLSTQHHFKNAADNQMQAKFQENEAVTLYYNGNPKFKTLSNGINVTGNVGIGTDNPGTRLHLYGGSDENITLKLEPGATAGNYSELVLGRTSSEPIVRTTPVVKGGVPISGIAGILFGSESTHLPAIGFQTPNTNGGHIVFKPKGTEKLRIDSSGRILKGLETARGNFANNTSGVEYGFQIEGTTGITAGLSIIRNSDDINDGGIVLGKTRATSNGVATPTVVDPGDHLGTITWAGSDGTTLQFGAEMLAEVQSGVGNDDMPTDLIFKINGGSTSTAERLRITSGGLNVTGAITADDLRTDNSQTFYLTTANDFRFRHTGGTEKLRITNGGSVGIGSAIPTGKFDIAPGGNSFIKFGQDADNPKVEFFRSTGGSPSHYGIELQQILGDFIFSTAGAADLGSHTYSEKLRIKSDGSVGIGTDNPTTQLQVNAASNESTISLYNGVTKKAALQVQNSFGTILYSYDNEPLKFSVASGTSYSEKLRINSDGKATFTGDIATAQDYPDFRPTIDFNFAAAKKLDSRIKYTRTGLASFINEFGLVEKVSANVPRFDHDPDTRECKGLLIEAARTNVIGYSDAPNPNTGNLGGAAQTNGTATTTLPTGETGTVREFLGYAGGGGIRFGDFSGTNNTTYSGSLWVRTVSGTGAVSIDMNDGDVKSNLPISTQWKRISSTHTTNNTYRFLDLYFENPVTVYIWGVQIEASPHMTSYIPTFAGGSSRGADVAVIDGQNFTDFYNPNESSVLAVGTLDRPASAQGQLNIFHIGDSNEDGHGVFREHGTKDVWYHIRNNNSTPSGGNLNPSGFGDWDEDEEARIALAFKDGDQAISVNGGNQITATVTSSYPTADITKMWIGSTGTGSYFEGTISRIAYYPKLLTDSQLNTITS